MDGGIDFRHEDLADNMWRNPEQTGDRVYGYNFLNDNYRVTPEEHGTHVAGTIAAVNNNGIGVCGIAGGDAAARLGAELLALVDRARREGIDAEAALAAATDAFIEKCGKNP